MAEQYYGIDLTSHKCHRSQTEGDVTGVATNFTIQGLRAGTEYNILVTAINSAGNFTTNLLSIHTLEMGECIDNVHEIGSIINVNQLCKNALFWYQIHSNVVCK